MIAKLIPLFVIIAAAATEKPYEGVDSNSLSCDPLGQVFLLLPHFTDCNKFYMCAHGIEVEFSCSPGLIFDFELQTCNWDWATTCGLRHPKTEEEENTDSEGSGDGGTEWIPDWSTEGSGDDDVVGHEDIAHFGNTVIHCANHSDNTKQVPYKGDCQRYWRCQDGVPQVLYCSDGLFFNGKTQQCDFEANVTCLVEAEDELAGEYIVS